MKKRYKKINKLGIIISVVSLCIAIILTIGFSSFTSDFSVYGYALFRLQRDIRITGISVLNSTSNVVSQWEEYNINNIGASVNLPYSNSTVTYNVKVTNVGNLEASISDVSGLPSNLTYTINNYNLRDMLCDDNNSSQCKLGATKTISITIGYKSNGYNSQKTNYVFGMDFTFSYMIDSVAKVGDSYYDSLQEAINAVPDDKNNTTTVLLLKNTSEIIEIGKNKNIALNLNNKTLSNSGNSPVIKNNGILNISNGTVTSNANQGTINNESTGNISITGGRIIATGGRQALYNNKGTATISGSAYLSATTDVRAAVQNLAGGTLYILGGTIVSTGFHGVLNAGVMTIGTKDGAIDYNAPLIQGKESGVSATGNFNFYDGIIKGIASSIDNKNKIVDIETGYNIIDDEETIDDVVYRTAYIGISNTVTFNPNSGTVSEATRNVATGRRIGTLPVPIRNGYDFIGWFDISDVQVRPDRIIDSDITFYAHWQKITNVAQIGQTIYDSLTAAINAVPNNTPTTITLLKNINESVTVTSSKNITFDLNGKVLKNAGKNAVIENSGNITIMNGTITSDADVGAINNNSGNVLITTGSRIIATGTRQAVYIIAGTVEINSDAYLSSQTSGTPTTSTMERGTIQCLSGGTIIITGGTIIGSKQQAVSNEGNLTIGVKDGNIDTSLPVLIGGVHGIKTTGTFNFYDGIIKGKTDAIDGSITEQEDNSQLAYGTETISGSSYATIYLEENE